jgi:hypothetical protein
MLFQSTMVLLAMLATDNTPNQSFELRCYPEKLQIGDTLYIQVVYHNKTDEEEIQPVPGLRGQILGMTDTLFTFSNHQGQKWSQVLERDYLITFNVTFSREPFYVIKCPPNTSTNVITESFSFPSLEDLYQSDFWNELIETKSDNLNEYPLDFEVEFNSFEKVFGQFNKFKRFNDKRLALQQKVILTQRLEKENALLRQWFENTPKENFPKLSKESQSYSKSTPTDRGRQKPRQKILGYDFKYFIPVGNRYPGDPNAPETWQGWKEFEDSLSSSTMKDEIRLTRIIIQYCDTKDPKVLDELEKWFVGMNEIQRMCMAKSVFDRMGLCDELLSPEEVKHLIPLYQDLYKTIQKYDIAAKSEDGIEWLKKQGLLE